MESRLSDQILAAQNLLTPSSWIRGNYFRCVNESVCFCSHGALQSVVNPEVQVELANVDLAAAAAGANRAATAVDTAGADTITATATAIAAACAGRLAGVLVPRARPGVRVALTGNIAGTMTNQLHDSTQNYQSLLISSFNDRPSWVKENKIIDQRNFGNLDAHFLLGLVGLTASFNDGSNTTFEMVKGKFMEAYKLALAIESLE